MRGADTGRCRSPASRQWTEHSANRSRRELAAFERSLNKKNEALDPHWLRDLAARFDAVALDIGTGDGRFVIESARAQPHRLWIGLDPVAENMAEASRTAAANPRKGGLVNALFL